MSAHTPGPWLWRAKSGALHQKGDGGYEYGAPVLVPTYEYDTGVDVEVSEADARLIAAAPDMYEALCRVLEIFNITHGDLYCIERAHAAVDLVEGRHNG